MIHAFGWAADDWDRLACGIVAGHIIECGAQSTGGNVTDWRPIPKFESIGYPIVEVFPDGSFIVTKHAGTGGMVTVRSETRNQHGDVLQLSTVRIVVPRSAAVDGAGA